MQAILAEADQMDRSSGTIRDDDKKDRRVADERLEAIASQVSESHSRLSAIEASVGDMRSLLAKMSETMIVVARVEERLANTQEQTIRMGAEIADLRTEVKILTATNARQDTSSAGGTEKSRWMERFVFGLIMAAVLAYFNGSWAG